MNSSLTLESLRKAMEMLPPPMTPMTIIAPLQHRMNADLNAQLETIRHTPGITIVHDPYFPDEVPPVRSRYATRKGWKMARNYWRGRKRRGIAFFYLMSQKLSQHAFEFEESVFRGLFSGR